MGFIRTHFSGVLLEAALGLILVIAGMAFLTAAATLAPWAVDVLLFYFV